MERNSAFVSVEGIESLDSFPVLPRFFRILTELGVETIFSPCESGAEVKFINEVNGIPNRAHLRIFFATPTKCVLFFHKKSSIPFSRDRFSYGGVVIDSRSTQRFEDREIREWVDFLLSGLNPDKKPPTLKKSLPYTIPED